MKKEPGMRGRHVPRYFKLSSFGFSTMTSGWGKGKSHGGFDFPEGHSKKLGQATDVSPRMYWGHLGLGWKRTKKKTKEKRKRKIGLAKEFRQALGPSSCRWGGTQALLSRNWLGHASGDGYLGDHRANHMSVPDRPFLRGFLGGIGSGAKPAPLHVPEPGTTLLFGCRLGGGRGVEMEGRTTQQDLGPSFLTMCAVATIPDKPA